MLSVTDNSRGRAVIRGHIVSPAQIARLVTKYSRSDHADAALTDGLPAIARNNSVPPPLAS
jgi:hypothetical protein